MKIKRNNKREKIKGIRNRSKNNKPKSASTTTATAAAAAVNSEREWWIWLVPLVNTIRSSF
jgi:hypothetical protein